MNERIRELIEQATTKQDFYPAGCNGYPDYRYEFDKEKFAELLIRDCINCTKEWYDARKSDSARDYSRGYVHGCDEAIAEMKKRFGVE